MSGLFKHPVQNAGHILPDGIAVGPHNHKALDAGIIHQLRLQADVGVPLGEILLHGGNGFHSLLVLCHSVSLLSQCPQAHKITSSILAKPAGNVKGYPLFRGRSPIFLSIRRPGAHPPPLIRSALVSFPQEAPQRGGLRLRPRSIPTLSPLPGSIRPSRKIRSAPAAKALRETPLHCFRPPERGGIFLSTARRFAIMI